jgi:hypothetical protein
MAVSATRTIKVRFDGTAKGLIAAAAKAGIAVEGFEKQANKSSANIAKSGGGLVGGLIDTLGSLPSVLKGAAIVAAAGIGVVMAPAIASAIISGVMVAVGGGVLAAGIIGAAKDPKVVKAWQKVGRQATVIFERFSKPFIKPLERSAKFFSAALARSEPTIRRIGETMAPFVEQLAFSAALFIEKLLPGILTATTEAQPFIAIMLDHLPKLAEAIGGFFTAISAGSDSAQLFFDRFLTWVEDVIPKLGGVLAWLANLKPKIDEVSARLTPIKDALVAVGDFIVTGMKEARDLFHKWLDDNKVKIDTFIGQLGGFVKDTGPAFRLTILGIAFAFILFADNVILLVDALNKLKNWYNANKSWLQIFTILPIGGSGAILGKLPGKAGGGPVDAGRSYLVGEKGPEILRMGSRGGHVVPNHQLSQASDGGTSGPLVIENHIEIGGEVVRVVRTEIRASDRALKRAVLAGSGAR